MTYVVSKACINNKHTDCVDVCPVDAFREGPDMLYIDPEVCIDCNACLTECPERAIYPLSAVPEDQINFIALNAEQAKISPIIRESLNGKALNRDSALEGRFAIVGSGPAGFYAAEALLKQMPFGKVDIFERLPTPFGLVRYGVAPDHPRIKSVSTSFERIAESDQVRFLGNVQIGKDITTEELRDHYHGVIYATGGSKSRPLTIEGAELPNTFGSSDFVGWYNGHPDHQNLTPDLSHKRAAVIGIGNVALDIARILCLSYDTLKTTDIADPALNSIRDAGITEVCLMARRGPAQAAFTPKELEQLIGITDLNLLVDASDLVLDAEALAELDRPEHSEAKQNLALLQQIATRRLSDDPAAKTIRFMFHASPKSMREGTNGKELTFGRNTLQRDENNRVSAVASGKTETISIGLLVNATGYQGQGVAGLPFDENHGVIANQDSCVDPDSEQPKQYVAGWIKRGASGVIGSNKQCASDTVARVFENLPEALDPITTDIAVLLEARNVAFVDFADWRLLDRYEVKQGKVEGRTRKKEISVAAMLNVIAAAKAAEVEAKTNTPVKTHFRTCTLCEAMCGLKIEYQGEKILSISGDEKDQHSTGHICPKGYALQDLHNDPDRLKKPMQKVDGQWLEISWDEALDITAQKLFDVQQAYGSDAVGAYWGNPTSHNFGLMMATNTLRSVLGTKNIFSAGSLDQMPHQLMSHWMFGLANAFTIPDIDHTDYMLMLGSNPAASNGSLMSAGDVLKRLQAIEKRGGKFVLVDPRKTETARYATEHHYIRPTTDALFLIGMIQHVINTNLCKPGRLKPMMSHWEELLGLFDLFPMSKITELCGIPQAEIIRITEEFCAAPSAICYGRMGISTNRFGALNHWLINILNIITGNLDRRGGPMFTTPAMDVALKPGAAGSFGTFHSRVRGLPEFARELPAAAMYEEMTTPGEGQIKAFITFAGNPVLSSPNGSGLDQALSNMDFMVAVDFYLNETSRQADIILPPTGPFEHEQFDIVFNLLAVRNVAKFSEPLFEPAEGALSDWDIIQELIKRFSALKGAPSMRSTTPKEVLDYALRTGPYANGFDVYDGDEVIGHEDEMSLGVLKKYENGLDMGPMQPRLPEHLLTTGNKINVLPESVLKDLARLKSYVHSLDNDNALVLVGRRDLRTNNSWMHNSKRLVKGKDRCGLFMNPKDAATKGLETGSKAIVRSRVGELTVAIEVTDNIMPGVVCLPHGWGHDLEGVELSVAKTNPGLNSNILTDDQLIDELSGNAVLNGVPVQVKGF